MGQPGDPCSFGNRRGRDNPAGSADGSVTEPVRDRTPHLELTKLNATRSVLNDPRFKEPTRSTTQRTDPSTPQRTDPVHHWKKRARELEGCPHGSEEEARGDQSREGIDNIRERRASGEVLRSAALPFRLFEPSWALWLARSPVSPPSDPPR
eukprot:2563755-Pyramimonas_sp.AAC.1